MSKQCAVCKKFVADADVEEHLGTNHLGPYYFWFDARKYRTMSPSMQIADIKKLADASPLYQVYEERDGGDIPWGDCEHVDITYEPHFFATPPATY